MEVWKYDIGIEKRLEDAKNELTRIKRVKYEKLKIENQIKIKQQQIASLDTSDPFYKLCAKNDELNLTILERNKEITDVSNENLELQIQICDNALTEYNQYIDKATNFLKIHNIPNIKIDYLIDKTQMDSHIISLYDKAKQKYDRYFQKKDNLLYKWMPFIKPDKWDNELKILEEELVKDVIYIDNLQNMFPETRDILKKHIQQIQFITEFSNLDNKMIENNPTDKQKILAIADKIKFYESESNGELLRLR